MRARQVSLLLMLFIWSAAIAQYDYSTELYEIPQLHVKFEFFKGAHKVSTQQGWKFTKKFGDPSIGDVLMAEVVIDTTVHCGNRKNFVDFRKYVADQIKQPVEDEFYDLILGYYSAMYYGYSWYRPTLKYYQVTGLKNASLNFHFEIKEYVLKDVDPKDLMNSITFTDEWKKFPRANVEIPSKGGLVVMQSPDMPQKFKATTCSDFFENKKLSVLFEIVDFAERAALPQQFEAYYQNISGIAGYKWSNQYGYDRLLELSADFKSYGSESVLFEYLIKSEPNNRKSYEELFIREIFAMRSDGKLVKITAIFPLEYGWQNRSDTETSLIGKFDKHIFENTIHRIKM